MRTIHKFKVSEDTVPMRTGARILTVHVQNGDIFVWADVDDAAPMVRRLLSVVGTGQGIPRGIYVGTAHMPSGFVWHVFDCGEIA